METERTGAGLHSPTHRPGMNCCRGTKGLGQLPPADLTKGMHDLSLVLQVSVIKVKIHEATGMPAGKQKLQYEVSWVSGPASWDPTPVLS